MNRLIMEFALFIMRDAELDICGYNLFNDYREFADCLIENNWLNWVGVNEFTRAYDGNFVPIFWDEEQSLYQYSSNGTWCYISKREASQYKLNMDKFLSFVSELLLLPKDNPPEMLFDNCFWYLGADRVNYYFVCSHTLVENNEALDELILLESKRSPSIFIVDQPIRWKKVRLSSRSHLIEVNSLFVRNRDLCEFDHGLIKSLACELTVPMPDPDNLPVYSTDYRLVTWSGGTYTLTKKQAAVLEALNNAGGKAQGDYLSAAANSNQTVQQIMRNKVNGEWVPHPLMGTLIKNDGKGYFYLDPTHH